MICLVDPSPHPNQRVVFRFVNVFFLFSRGSLGFCGLSWNRDSLKFQYVLTSFPEFFPSPSFLHNGQVTNGSSLFTCFGVLWNGWHFFWVNREILCGRFYDVPGLTFIYQLKVKPNLEFLDLWPYSLGFAFDKIFQAKGLTGCHYSGRNTVLLSCKIFSGGQWSFSPRDVFCVPTGEANTQRSYSLQLCGLSLGVRIMPVKDEHSRFFCCYHFIQTSHEDFILYPPWPVTEIDPCGASFVNWTLKF